ncbi:MAG TPA: cytochrome D1 [Thermoanaerobaculia bacterium]|nr:cytochrome D1 [Thermoanaerobaculia bacterium]
MKTTASLFTSLLLGALAAGPAPASVPPAPSPSAPAAASRSVSAGVAVDLSVQPAGSGAATGEVREGQEAVFRFKIFDTATKTPLSGAYPAAWMDFLPDAPTTESRGCTERVEELIAGSLLAQPEVDLNVYHVLALNEDSTISVVNPLFGFGGSKLLAMLFLDGPGEDWVLSQDRKRLFVSLPAANEVAVVDTLAWKVVANVAVGLRPTRLVLQPDGAYLWVTLEGGAAALDLDKLAVAAVVPTGRGRHELAVADDSRLVYVSNGDDRTLSVIEVSRLAKRKDVPLGAAPTAIAFSPLARAVYVSSEEAGAVVAVGGPGPEVMARMAAAPGLGQIRFAPGGRLGLVVNPRSNQVHVLDAARNRIIQTASMQGGPDQVTFSEHLAYVRLRNSETVLMIPLEQLGEEGKPVPVVDFPGGEHPLGVVSRPSPADSIVRAPGANAVLVANPADKAIYFYKEGMAAPLGSFQNYGHEPRAVMVVDRSLKERSPGSYETVARLPGPGHYQVAFFLDTPRAVHCFPVTVAADPELEKKRAQQRPALLEPLVADAREVRVGQLVPLRFRISDAGTHKPKDGLQDVEVMVYSAAVEGQWRALAKSIGEGVYEVEFTPREAADYHVAVECPSQNLPFHLSPRVILQVVPEAAAPSP